jgi:hypothetical protein
MKLAIINTLTLQGKNLFFKKPVKFLLIKVVPEMNTDLGVAHGKPGSDFRS